MIPVIIIISNRIIIVCFKIAIVSITIIRITYIIIGSNIISKNLIRVIRITGITFILIIVMLIMMRLICVFVFDVPRPQPESGTPPRKRGCRAKHHLAPV